MAILVAPLVSQLSVLPVPELMLAGAAVKEVIAGAEPVPEFGFDCTAAVQPSSPTQATRISTIAQEPNSEARSLRVLGRILQNEPAGSIRSPWMALDGIILATPPPPQCVLQRPHRSQRMTFVMTKMVGKQTALRFLDEERCIGLGFDAAKTKRRVPFAPRPRGPGKLRSFLLPRSLAPLLPDLPLPCSPSLR
jgi:hypothetical protein